MTGKKTEKTRIIVSARLLVPTSACRGLEQKAIEFRRSVNAASKQNKLVADLAIKAANIGSKPTYEDTDNKKRDFTGGNVPGLIQENGNRWMKDKKYEPGDILQLFPSRRSRLSSDPKPNFGWIKPPDQSSGEVSLGGVSITKYKTNPKTGEIIPETGVELDPLAPWSGRSFEENMALKERGTDKKFGNQNEKCFPADH